MRVQMTVDSRQLKVDRPQRLLVNCPSTAQTREPLLFTTVVPQLNQGTAPKTGRNRFRAAFFGYFFGGAKK